MTTVRDSSVQDAPAPLRPVMVGERRDADAIMSEPVAEAGATAPWYLFAAGEPLEVAA